ncbi:hypothetical protein BKA70DRAFT_1576662 [Coprinopsis sp. MPI-PUGE-AT-0042]|nr:hypothetical protein BKA70DRAFT_1576662 [Coprinopsis sp. MPI-PUGE-AT-0042]
MHRCLQIPEILLNVLEDLHFNKAGEWTPCNAAPLAALARTCKAFYHPAVKVLWSDLPGLSTISYLMPESMYTLDDGSLRLCAGLSTDFLERLNLHAPLVKFIRLGMKKEARRLHPSTLLALSSPFAASYPIFPNLKRVQLPCNENEPMEAMFYPAVVLGSRSLAEITVYTNDKVRLDETGQWRTKSDESQWEAFTNRIVPFAPQLEKLLISKTGKTKERLLSTPHLVRLCASLSSSMINLDVTSIQLPCAAILALGSLGQLATLSISVNDQNFGGSPTSNTPVIFHQLNYLAVNVSSLASGGAFFRAMDPARLQDLVLRIHSNSANLTELDVSPALNCLTHWACAATLSKVFIRKTSNSVKFQFRATDATLLPLTAFKNLKELLIFPCINHLSDKGLLAAFSSWTKLEYLLLHVYTALKQCPSLTRLGLECDCREIPPLEDPVPPHKLTSWRVNCSPIANGHGFAEWAKVCFPGLRKFEYFISLQILANSNFDEVWRTARRSLIYLDQWNDVPKILGLKK